MARGLGHREARREWGSKREKVRKRQRRQEKARGNPSAIRFWGGGPTGVQLGPTGPNGQRALSTPSGRLSDAVTLHGGRDSPIKCALRMLAGWLSRSSGETSGIVSGAEPSRANCTSPGGSFANPLGHGPRSSRSCGSCEAFLHIAFVWTISYSYIQYELIVDLC